MPDKDAVIIFTADSPDMWGELDMVWKYLYPGIEDKSLPADEKASNELKQRLTSLALAVPAKKDNDSLTSIVSGKTFTFEPNDRHIQSISLEFKDELCNLNLKTDTASFDFSFASGRWQHGETTRHGPSIFAQAKNNQNGLPPFKIAQAYTWLNTRTLELTLRYIENVQTEKIIIRFDENEKNKIRLDLRINNARPGRALPLEGTMQ
jgi:hypothetical protein